MPARFCQVTKSTLLPVVAFGLLFVSSGCLTCVPPADGSFIPPRVPNELNKVTQPPHIIEPLDVLSINALRVTPLGQFRLETGDTLLLQVEDISPDQKEPIVKVAQVDQGGMIDLGLAYGSVRVSGLSTDEARREVEKHLNTVVGAKLARASIVPSQTSRPTQQIRGDHLVRPEGVVSLGLYGSVRVVGMTVEQARQAVEQHLALYLQRPEVSVEISAYNTKVYYVIFDGGGFGEQIVALPITGGDTVLDALSKVGGLPSSSSKRQIWLARRNPLEPGCVQRLCVDYAGITQRAEAEKNYQIFPGDRIYVKADQLIMTNNVLTKVFAPLERIFGITLLGSGTVNSFRTQGGGGGAGGGGF